MENSSIVQRQPMARYDARKCMFEKLLRGSCVECRNTNIYCFLTYQFAEGLLVQRHWLDKYPNIYDETNLPGLTASSPFLNADKLRYNKGKAVLGNLSNGAQCIAPNGGRNCVRRPRAQQADHVYTSFIQPLRATRPSF